MKLVIAKFSRIPTWDKEYMDTQKEYNFIIEENIEPKMVLFGDKYKKFLHVTSVQPFEKRGKPVFFSLVKKEYSSTKEDASFFKLAEIIFTGEMITETVNEAEVSYPIVKTV